MKLTINALAQEVHFVIGLFAVSIAVNLGLPWWYGAVAILAIALVKEAIFDPAPMPVGENAPFLWNGVVDWCFYVLGVVTAYAILVIIWTSR